MINERDAGGDFRTSASPSAEPTGSVQRSVTADRPQPLEMLRSATSRCHSDVEAAIDWMAAFQSYQTYRQLLQRFALLVPPLERSIAAQLADDTPPEFEADARTQWLEHDLAVMARIIGAESQESGANSRAALASFDSSHSVDEAPDFSYISSRAAAIGALYVLEGSSLGGQFLSRQLQDRLHLTADHGGCYFSAYGSATAKHWQAFRQWANFQLEAPEATLRAVEAAKITFERFGKALAASVNE